MNLLRSKKDKKIYKEIKKELLKYKKKPVLIHTEINKSFFLKNNNHSIVNLLQNHWKLLFGLTNKKNLLVPSFNYNFTKNKKFDVNKDESQVGHLNEFFRKNISNWRSEIPVFSICGLSVTKPEWANINRKIEDPFDNNSVFAYLFKNKGACFFYGANISASTIIHYVERLAGLTKVSFYRFDKYFDGVVTNNKKKN